MIRRPERERLPLQVALSFAWPQNNSLERTGYAAAEARDNRDTGFWNKV